MVRKYSDAFKQQVVEEALAPGASVARVARKRDLNANMVFTWRKEHREGKFGNWPASETALPGPEFVAVGIVDEVGQPASATAPPAVERIKLPQRAAPRVIPVSRSIELELRNGVKLRVDAGIPTETLRRIVGALAAV